MYGLPTSQRFLEVPLPRKSVLDARFRISSLAFSHTNDKVEAYWKRVTEKSCMFRFILVCQVEIFQIIAFYWKLASEGASSS